MTAMNGQKLFWLQFAVSCALLSLFVFMTIREHRAKAEALSAQAETLRWRTMAYSLCDQTANAVKNYSNAVARLEDCAQRLEEWRRFGRAIQGEP